MDDQTSFRSRLGIFLPVALHATLAVILIGIAVCALEFVIILYDGVRGWWPRPAKLYFGLLKLLWRWHLTGITLGFLTGCLIIGDYAIIRHWVRIGHLAGARRWSIIVTLALSALVLFSLFALYAPFLQIWYLNR